MKQIRRKGKKRVPRLAFTVRFSKEHYDRLEQMSQELDWSMQKVIVFLTTFAKPMTPAFLNQEAINRANEEWIAAARIGAAKREAAALIAAARNPGKVIMQQLLAGGNLATGILVPLPAKRKDGAK